MVRGSVPGHAQALSALRQARSGGAAAQNPPRVLPARRTAGGPNIFFSERTRSEETADVPFRDVTRCEEKGRAGERERTKREKGREEEKEREIERDGKKREKRG